MECCRMTSAAEHRRPVPSDGEAILNALPNPVLLVAPDGKIVDANMAAESFFEISAQFLQRQSLKELVPFGSPLLALIDQVRSSGSPVNEYKVDLGTPRIGGDRQVDLHVAVAANSWCTQIDLVLVDRRAARTDLIDQRKQRTAERHQFLQRLALQELRGNLEKRFRGHIGIDNPAIGRDQQHRIRECVQDGVAIGRRWPAMFGGRSHAAALHAKASYAS